MTVRKVEKLARMANQIGDFHAVMPREEGAAGVALHIRRFWTPKMIADLAAAVDEKTVDLNPTACAGLAALLEAKTAH